MKRIYKETSEADLLTLIRGTSRREADAAFAEVIRRNENTLKFFIMRKVRCEADREDIYAMTISKAWKKIQDFDSTRGKISTWIFTIAYHLIVDMHRQAKNDAYLSDMTNNNHDDDNSGDYEVADHSMLANKPLENQQRNAIVRSAIDKAFTNIDDPHRIVLEHRYILELSYEEIVEMTGFSLGSVKSWLFRAKSQLKKTIVAEYAGAELDALLTA